ncbi:hypothetical protein H6P81_008587 [Aristolochia fimbriata]|uniref:Uncharacterized protein n=1 Tax=Aristolochia fimbriata TaxID=158543 RepID=A0AAV7ELQ5_ARIFI|nr:hypothetical protein H6P81_008587 [Aristolochia fimbriata]
MSSYGVVASGITWPTQGGWERWAREKVGDRKRVPAQMRKVTWLQAREREGGAAHVRPSLAVHLPHGEPLPSPGPAPTPRSLFFVRGDETEPNGTVSLHSPAPFNDRRRQKGSRLPLTDGVRRVE